MLKWCYGLVVFFAAVAMEVQMCGLYWTARTAADRDEAMVMLLLMLGVFAGLGLALIWMVRAEEEKNPREPIEPSAELQALWDELDAPYYDYDPEAGAKD